MARRQARLRITELMEKKKEKNEKSKKLARPSTFVFIQDDEDSSEFDLEKLEEEEFMVSVEKQTPRGGGYRDYFIQKDKLDLLKGSPTQGRERILSHSKTVKLESCRDVSIRFIEGNEGRLKLGPVKEDEQNLSEGSCSSPSSGISRLALDDNKGNEGVLKMTPILDYGQLGHVEGTFRPEDVQLGTRKELLSESSHPHDISKWDDRDMVLLIKDDDISSGTSKNRNKPFSTESLHSRGSIKSSKAAQFLDFHSSMNLHEITPIKIQPILPDKSGCDGKEIDTKKVNKIVRALQTKSGHLPDLVPYSNNSPRIDEKIEDGSGAQNYNMISSGDEPSNLSSRIEAFRRKISALNEHQNFKDSQVMKNRKSKRENGYFTSRNSEIDPLNIMPSLEQTGPDRILPRCETQKINFQKKRNSEHFTEKTIETPRNNRKKGKVLYPNMENTLFTRKDPIKQRSSKPKLPIWIQSNLTKESPLIQQNPPHSFFSELITTKTNTQKGPKAYMGNLSKLKLDLIKQISHYNPALKSHRKTSEPFNPSPNHSKKMNKTVRANRSDCQDAIEVEMREERWTDQRIRGLDTITEMSTSALVNVIQSILVTNGLDPFVVRSCLL